MRGEKCFQILAAIPAFGGEARGAEPSAPDFEGDPARLNFRDGNLGMRLSGQSAAE